MSSRPNKLYYTTGTVAHIIGTSRQTVSNWCVDGTIKAIRPPRGQFKIHKDEVDKLVNRMGYDKDSETLMTENILEDLVDKKLIKDAIAGIKAYLFRKQYEKIPELIETIEKELASLYKSRIV
jgi:excisionase family DNA binding protein